jgi:DNA adenine methylase
VARGIDFTHGDAFEEMARFKNDPDAVFFIDPPYTAGGKRAGSRLYRHCDIDHEKLFSICEQLRGDFLLTYDNAEEVGELAARHGFETKPVAMNNTHHAEMNELLIGRDLGWVEKGGVFREAPAPYRAISRKSARKD